MRKAFIVFCCLWVLTLSQEESVCYDSLVKYCNANVGSHSVRESCGACYGGFLAQDNKTLHELQSFTNAHVAANFDYLLLATNFGSYVKDRKGFEKLYRHLSDSAWEDGIDLIKYISKRGGSMDFYRNTGATTSVASLNEIESLGRAMDIHKSLAKQSFEIHERASKATEHEPEVTSYLENKFLHKHADIIRTLAGHITDVKAMIANFEQKSLSLFLFDEYLQEHSL